MTARPDAFAETSLVEDQRRDAALGESIPERCVVRARRTGAVQHDQGDLGVFAAKASKRNGRSVHRREIAVRTRALHACGFSKRQRAALRNALKARRSYVTLRSGPRHK